ncbi:FYDLN acid domain-containing protein [Rhodobacteraceae bacterium N5(2021)]|uniref:FYDLN acid domain-containing protein n=1 Tax=Gymnodinialimonas phycosphaerae TaxID=2841589 RepID=A0A975TTR8_9RHOB|nr:FYDLN acid domain-containing protein [Gymnodinialimonas phycosphaerae]MBY4894905.1 FYDLN acid domain-containing protein [Gymnodinialimonas phycosphaerae]
MPKEEWGVKRVCPTTGKRFYDLGASPIVSPYTGEVVVLETGKGGAQSLVADKAATKAKEVEDADDDLVLDDDIDIDDEDDADLPDDDVLDDDDEDTVALDDIADVASDDSDD